MAKQGQHRHDKHDHRLMPQAGHTNPRKRVKSEIRCTLLLWQTHTDPYL